MDTRGSHAVLNFYKKHMCRVVLCQKKRNILQNKTEV